MKLGNILQEKTKESYSYDKKKSDSDFSQIIEKKEQKQEQSKAESSSRTTVIDYQAMLSEHISYLREKIQNGDIEEKFQIGNEAMTIGEWNSMLDNFDDLQEQILQGMRERHEIQNKKKENNDEVWKLFEEREWLEEIREKAREERVRSYKENEVP